MISPPIVAAVDDDQDMRRSLETLIEHAGCRACIFEDAKAFLEWNVEHKAKCIVSDIQMPGMTGLELCTRLTRGGNRTPIILMSAFATVPMRQRAMAAGAHTFLAKPIDVGTFLDLLESIMSSPTEVS